VRVLDLASRRGGERKSALFACKRGLWEKVFTAMTYVKTEQHEPPGGRQRGEAAAADENDPVFQWVTD